jgi:hypothetical protein
MPKITRQELDEALSFVLQAPKTDAPISQLCFRPDFGQRDFRDTLTLTRHLGIPGERWLKHPWLRLTDGSPDPQIQVSILPQRVLDLVWQDRQSVPHPGDTIIADLNMTDENTPPDSLLKIGQAVLRVSKEPNDGCVKWKYRYGQDAMDWIACPENRSLRLRGLLCSIEEDGEISTSDRITVIR